MSSEARADGAIFLEHSELKITFSVNVQLQRFFLRYHVYTVLLRKEAAVWFQTKQESAKMAYAPIPYHPTYNSD